MSKFTHKRLANLLNEQDGTNQDGAYNTIVISQDGTIATHIGDVIIRLGSLVYSHLYTNPKVYDVETKDYIKAPARPFKSSQDDYELVKDMLEYISAYVYHAESGVRSCTAGSASIIFNMLHKFGGELPNAQELKVQAISLLQALSYDPDERSVGRAAKEGFEGALQLDSSLKGHFGEAAGESVVDGAAGASAGHDVQAAGDVAPDCE